MKGKFHTLILFGPEQDGELLNFLQIGLASRYRLHIHSQSRLSSVGSGADLLVIDTDCLRDIALKDCVLLLKANAGLEGLIGISADCRAVAIANSRNSRQLDALARLGIPIISCGMLAKDTLTYSSRTDDGVVISLQRSVSSLYGKEIEPLEVPLMLPARVCGYSLLAYAALCILLDDANFLNNIVNFYK